MHRNICIEDTLGLRDAALLVECLPGLYTQVDLSVPHKQMLWHTPVIQALQRERQEDQKFKVFLRSLMYDRVSFYVRKVPYYRLGVFCGDAEEGPLPCAL